MFFDSTLKAVFAELLITHRQLFQKYSIIVIKLGRIYNRYFDSRRCFDLIQHIIFKSK